MEDAKRDLNKTKRSKSDHVRNTIAAYLQKRNYATAGILENSRLDQQQIYSIVETEISRPNSVLYSCYNSDPAVIDHNFGKFLSWVKDLVKAKNTCHDLEYIVAPLFVHLYLDILKGGHSERAATFFKAHLPAIDRTKCDDFVRDLMNLLANDTDATCLKEQYRSNKYYLELSATSTSVLKKFIAENCHVIFLHVLQTWFELKENEDLENEIQEFETEEDQVMKPNGVHVDNKLEKFRNTLQELENEPQQVFVLNISNFKEPVTCALINRASGLLAYNQTSIVHLRPIHSLDPIVGCDDCKEIRLMNHSKQVYSISISMDYTILVTSSADCTMCIYDLTDLQLMKTCTGHLGPVYGTAVSSNNMYVATASQDTTARLWNIETGQTVRLFAGHTQAVTCIDFHPNCLYVATGSDDKNIRLWSIDNGNPLRLFHGSKGAVYAVAFSPLGNSLASASDDKRVRIWDVLSSRILLEFKHRGEIITKVAWSSDGKQICGGSIDGTVRVWDVCSVQETSEVRNIEPILSCSANGKVLNVEFSSSTFACVSS